MPAVTVVCVVCAEPFEARSARSKLCSDRCRKARAASWYRDYYAAGNAYDSACSSCGKGMRRGGTSLGAGEAKCLPCRRVHGTHGMYDGGCRCAECKAFKAARAREFNAAYKAEHGVSYTIHYRQKRAEAGDPVTGRVRHWITRERRLSIYERDGYVCHLCGVDCPREFSVDDRTSPTLDHLVPVSQGGGNESSNLKTACWSCNSSRRDRALV